ncbi:MAG: NifB/NifX family molybdenum-iron cluster-binding protein [Halothiobacillaceae bacterium]
MKLCITAKGNNLDAAIDPSFGRCQYFIFVDSETLQFEAVENPNTRASGGAGTNSGQLIANKGTDVLLTGDVGPNAARVLAAAGVNVVTGATGTVREAVTAWKKGAS